MPGHAGREGEGGCNREIKKRDQGNVSFSWSTSWRCGEVTRSPLPSLPRLLHCPKLSVPRETSVIPTPQNPGPTWPCSRSYSHIQPALGRPQTQKKHAHTFLVGTLIFKNSASRASTCHGAWIRTKTEPWLLLCKGRGRRKRNT